LPRAVELARARRDHETAELRGLAAARSCGRLLEGRPRHLDVQVEPIEQRTRDAAPVVLETRGRAPAAVRAVAAVAAGARVHCRDQLKLRRELDLLVDPRDPGDACLERLAQRLERGPREFRKLVEKEHAAM